jgi:lipopolysaccharide/colanic/teichoic acid biosynthesis glycosyltransferase
MVKECRADHRSFGPAADDPRVTRLGRILRATSLDEPPQLINVSQGEMSLGVSAERPVLIQYFRTIDSRVYARATK